MQKITSWFKSLPSRLKPRLNRGTSANVLMLSFILCTSIGAGLIFAPAGLVVAGITCGIFGYLLGLE